MFEVTVGDGRSLVATFDIDIAWDELGARLAERAAMRLQVTPRDEHEKFWVWQRPLKVIEATLKKMKDEGKP